ncbi:germination protein M [Fontibacillus phaseoli]|uniref:Germination protein M n=1 Tax=Fontibacillus phaseoli TaxID=1416533 RepID=A0A369BGU1_9BACL|nr:GerMN domain-containing protein [Fontibacillus phaseoli]RCX19818.1 germination protein M [Fontibacillus phaseoli]
MKWNRHLRNTAAAGVLTIPLLLSGCSLLGINPSASIDPPPSDVEAQMLQSLEPTNQTSQTSKANLDTEEASSTVYLKNEQGWLVPVSLHLPKGEAADKLNRMLGVLIESGPYQGVVPAGFSGVLPAGTEVKAVTLKKDEKLAIVEFNKSFGNYEAANERKILEAVTWTLLGDQDIEHVQLWMDGAKLNEMPVNGTPLDRPLNRSLGINLELGDGVSLSQTRPVTVFFTASTPGGVQYFVPVTRFVSADKNPVTGALGELIKGPSRGDGLERVMTDNTVLKAVELSEDGVITVSIEDDMFEAGEKPPAQMLQSLVLTVTENARDNKVRIWLNGQKDVIGMDNEKYGEPVLRPESINEIPF